MIASFIWTKKSQTLAVALLWEPDDFVCNCLFKDIGAGCHGIKDAQQTTGPEDMPNVERCESHSAPK